MYNMIYLLVLTIGVWNLAMTRSHQKRTLLSDLNDGLHVCLAVLLLTLQYLSPEMPSLLMAMIIGVLLWTPVRNRFGKKTGLPLHHR